MAFDSSSYVKPHDLEVNQRQDISQISILTRILVLLLSVTAVSSIFVILRLRQILHRPRPAGKYCPRPAVRSLTVNNHQLPNLSRQESQHLETHLLIVLGSGGHTAEMLNILSNLQDLTQKYTLRTYIVSSGDGFSARKATEFEKTLLRSQNDHSGPQDSSYRIVTVQRARRVHQGLLTAPWSTIQCLWDCILVLRGVHPELVGSRTSPRKASDNQYPDIILTNGPGTGVCLVSAALILLFFGFSGFAVRPSSIQRSNSSTMKDKRENDREETTMYKGSGQMRTIFIESWARVRTLSLTGKILKYLVDRFLVQWPQLAEQDPERIEYIGPLVS